MNTYSGPTKFARVLKAFQAIMLTLTLVTMSFPVSAFATENEEHGHTPITICHEGHAQTVDDDSSLINEESYLHDGEEQEGDDELCSGDDEEGDNDGDDEDNDDGDDEDTDEDEDTVSCTLSAVPSSITVGENSTLTLSIEGEDADELSAEVDQEVGQLSDGDTAVVTPTETTTYTATISGDHEDDDKKKKGDEEEGDDENWTATCSVTVTVDTEDDDEGDTDDGAQCVIVSDTLTNQGEVPAVLVTFIHSAWNTVTAALAPAKWIWGEDPVSPANTEKTETFTRTFSLVTAPTNATLEVSADNGFSVKVNGTALTPDLSGVETNYASVQSYDVASLLNEGENTIEFTVKNFAQSGGTPTSNPAGLIYKLSVADADCGDPEVDHITVVASKVVCVDEADLPNWGTGSGDGYVSPITATTAEDWVETHESCEIVPDWQFEWGNQSAPDMGRDFIGVSGNENYHVFSAGDEVEIPLSALGEGSVHLREVLQKGYIPFTFDQTEGHQNNENNVSAEFYCADDVLNYDNWDFINGPEEGETYYCVGFNAPKEKEPTCNPEINLLKNGGFETPDVGAGSYDIIADSNPLLAWLVAWTSLEDGGRLGLEIQDHVAGNPAVGSGDQFAELDGDHPVTISQEVATVPGQQYELSFKYSPRAGRTAADNEITVKADGSVLGAVLSADGNTDGTTNWNDYFRTFTAADASTLIEFADTGTDTSYGGYLDDVSLHCVVPVEDTTVTVTKVVVGNENYDASDFPLFVGEEGVVSGVATEVKPGTYTVYESSNADFTPSFSGDCVADEDNEARQNLVEDFIAKKNAIQDSIDASPEDPDNAAKQALIEDIDAKIVALQNSLSATITVEEGEDAQCTITNTYNPKNSEEGTLVIVKETTGGNGAFDFDITGNEASIDADVQTENGTGSTEVSLLEGTYNLTETVLSGWTLDSVSCEYGEESAGESIPNGEQIYVEAGETVTCTFHNTKTAESSRRGGRRHGGGGGEVLGASTCGPLLTSYLKLGWANNADEVTKLQDFLNTNMNAGLPVSGFFGPMTFEAVKAFQKAHWEDVLKPWVGLPGSGIEGENTPTGFVYQTTRWQINNIFCPGSEAFPAKLD